jgi:hypothetical protein
LAAVGRPIPHRACCVNLGRNVRKQNVVLMLQPEDVPVRDAGPDDTVI